MRRRSLASSSSERKDGGYGDYERRPRGVPAVGPQQPARGPFYARDEGGNLVLGLRVAEKHTNARGFVHSGVLLTLADVALGYAAEGSVDPFTRLITTSVSADFAGSARLGDWVEARVDVQRVGRRMAFANAYLHVGDRRVGEGERSLRPHRRDVRREMSETTPRYKARNPTFEQTVKERIFGMRVARFFGFHLWKEARLDRRTGTKLPSAGEVQHAG